MTILALTPISLRAHVEADDGLFGTEIDPAYFDAFIHRRTQLVGVLQQHQIELAAIDVIGVFAIHAFLLAFVEPDVDVRLGVDLIGSLSLNPPWKFIS